VCKLTFKNKVENMFASSNSGDDHITFFHDTHIQYSTVDSYLACGPPSRMLVCNNSRCMRSNLVCTGQNDMLATS
jgi:hypothetical protein